MNEQFKGICDNIVAASLTPRRISKDAIIKRTVVPRDVVVKGAAEELLGQFAEMYLIPPDGKMEISDNSIENGSEEVYDSGNELAEMGVVR